MFSKTILALIAFAATSVIAQSQDQISIVYSIAYDCSDSNPKQKVHTYGVDSCPNIPKNAGSFEVISSVPADMSTMYLGSQKGCAGYVLAQDIEQYGCYQIKQGGIKYRSFSFEYA